MGDVTIRGRHILWTVAGLALAVVVLTVAIATELAGPQAFPVSFLALVVALVALAVLWLVRGVQQNELRLRTIVESAAEGIIITNSFGTIESFNPAATQLFGYREGEIVGSNVTVLLPSSYPDVEGGNLLDFLRKNKIEPTGVPYEVLGLRRDGKTFFMDLSVSEAWVHNDQVFTTIVRDATERKSAQEILRRSKQDLEKRVRKRTAELENANRRLRDEIAERERVEAERKKTLLKLRAALDEIKTLSGLIPICASCKKVRDDGGYWTQIEEYIRDRSDADFSHSVCPECIKELYPELDLDEVDP